MRKKLSVWTILWLAWGLAFLGIEIPAALNKRGGDTLSEHAWWWFSVDGERRFAVLRRIALVLFWVVGVGVAHFVFKASALWAVILPGIPFGFFIGWSVLHEGSPGEGTVAAPAAEGGAVGWLKTFAGKVWGGLKGGGAWLLRRGPLWSSLLVGVAVVVPGAAPILNTIAGLLAGASGGEVNQDMVKTFGEVLSGLLLLVGAIRKFWAMARPALVGTPDK